MALIPTEITAGNTLDFLYDGGEYTPDAYTLTFNLVSSAHRYVVTGVDDGNNITHFVTSAADTENWEAGFFQYTILATAGADRFTVERGTLTISPNPALGGYDPRSHVKQTLDLLEQVIYNKVDKDTIAYSIGGRSISRMSLSEIQVLHDTYLARYEQEKQADRIAKGLGNSRKILVRIR